MDTELEIESLAPSRKDTKAQLAVLKQEKGRLGRQLSVARDSGGIPDELIRAMKVLSDEIKSLQKILKVQASEADRTQKWAPGELSPPRAVADKPVSGTISVKVLENASRASVQEYLDDHPATSLWHSPGILEFVKNTYSHPAFYLVAQENSGRLVGLLPLIQIKSRLFGNFIVSMPYFNYGGVLADNAEVAEALVQGANKLRQQKSAQHVELRPIRDTGLGLPQRTNKCVFWLPLPPKTDDLWASFKPKVRAQIRRGEREMTGFSVGGIELLDDFYLVFSQNMRDLGTPVYGKAFFRNLLHQLPSQSWLVIVRIGDRPVGAAFLTGFRGRMEIPWASTLRRYSHTGINMAMYWQILKLAIDLGFEVFDYGRCSESAGTFKFKQQWGARRIDLHWDYVLKTGDQLPALNPENPKYRLMIEVWRRLPLGVANWLGPKVVRMLP